MRGAARVFAIFLGLATVSAACGGAADSSPDGPVVRIYGPYRDAEADLFMAGLEEWADLAGIQVRYTGSANFVSDLQYQVREILSPPDIALIPQPGLVEQLAREGYTVAITGEVADVVGRNYGDEALELGRVGGDLVGFPYRANVKSLVWYRPEVLEGLGLTVPETLDELTSLLVQIEDAGLTPWCLGLEAQRATGWPATDWVEDLIVRREGIEVYGGWVDGTIPFSDPRIEGSFAEFRSLVLAPGRVAGGVSDVLSTSIEASAGPLFTDPPGCVLFKQASFAFGWMPSGLQLGPDGDVDFFVLPGQTAGTAAPVVAGADLAVAFSDRPEVAAVLARLATPEAGSAWAQGGSYVSPRSSIDPATYYRLEDRAVSDVLVRADALVFDGSDAMPPEIGTELFWSEITAWVSGQISYDQFAATMDAARGG